MNQDTNKFLVELAHATALVERIANREMTFAEFETGYENYFYAAALDGHEGSIPPQLEGCIGHAIDLHADAQGILDRTYHGVMTAGNPSSFASTGRITPRDAELELRQLAAKYDISDILRQIKAPLS